MSTNWTPEQPQIPTPPQAPTPPPAGPPWPAQPQLGQQAGQPPYQPGPAPYQPGPAQQPAGSAGPQVPPPPAAYPGGQAGYPGQGTSPGGWAPAAPASPPKSNGKLLGIAAGGVAVALLAGGGAMLVGQNLRKVDPAPLPAPAPSAPVNPAPTAPGSPAAPTTGTGTPNGTKVTIANGVSVTLPSASWTEFKRGDGSVTFKHVSGGVIVFAAVRPGQTSTATALCDRFVAEDSKILSNVSPLACASGTSVGRVSSAVGGLTGTYATQQGSVVLSETVGAGVRDDGLAGGFFVTYPSKQRPSDSVLAEAGKIYGSLLESINSAP